MWLYTLALDALWNWPVCEPCWTEIYGNYSFRFRPLLFICRLADLHCTNNKCWSIYWTLYQNWCFNVYFRVKCVFSWFLRPNTGQKQIGQNLAKLGWPKTSQIGIVHMISMTAVYMDACYICIHLSDNSYQYVCLELKQNTQNGHEFLDFILLCQ